MDIRPTRIYPLGDNAVTVEFGNEMSFDLNTAAISLADHFTRHPFPGLIEAVPAIASTTLFYDPYEVERSAQESPSAVVGRFIEDSIEGIEADDGNDTGNLITVPVDFGRECALDLSSIADHSGLSEEQVVEIFLSAEYRVFMLGFLPGFAYMGIVDERIAMPRHAKPRTSVPRGSVGIAGRQTGIYPAESPGGWRIIGRTSKDLFDPSRRVASIFSPGDRVRFTKE